MDTLSEAMTELLIDQNSRLNERIIDSGVNFVIKAAKAEKIIKENSGNEDKQGY